MKNLSSDDDEEQVEVVLKERRMEAMPTTTALPPPTSLPVPVASWQTDDLLLSPGQESLPGMGSPEFPCALPFPSSRSSQVLLLVLHGGGVLHSGLDDITKDIDLQNFSRLASNIMKVHYQHALGQVSIRLVRCPNICAKGLELLCLLNPVHISATDCSGLLPVYGASKSSFFNGSEQPGTASIRRRITNSLPLNVIALLGAECATYQPTLLDVCKSANSVYQEFLNSEEGRDFNGQVRKMRK